MDTGGPRSINPQALTNVINSSGVPMICIANNLGIQTNTLKEKIEGRRAFWWHEIVILNKMLRLTDEEFHKIFGP